jgi:hypothetical protein
VRDFGFDSNIEAALTRLPQPMGRVPWERVELCFADSVSMTTSAFIPFEALKPGDHVKITQRIKVGLKVWTTTVTGIVERTERRREGLTVKRNFDDKAFADLIVLKKDDPAGEETTLALDEYTHIDRA